MPNGANTWQSTSCTLANIYQIEHFNQRFVAWIRYTAHKSLLHIDTESTRICNTNFIRPFLNHQTTTVIVIGMNQGVCQSLAQSLMQRGVINAVSTIQFERNFYVLRNAVINAEIKVTDITTPIA